jgi:hypothetical protein
MLAGGKGGATANSMFIPLSLILRPDLLKELTTFANAVKNPSGIDTSNTEELFDASKEVFLSLLRGAPPVTE